MAQIVWTGRKTVDPDTLNPVYEVTVDGKRVGIRVSSEAETDRGQAAIRLAAEKKIRAALAAGNELKGISVTNADFQ